MSDVELHINVSGAGKPEQIAKLVQDAMALREPEIQTVIPPGYRCSECWCNDGGHEPSCDFKIAGGNKP